MKAENRIREVILVSCIIAFAGLIRLPSLTQPMGPDQGIMSVIGEGILNGGVPYRDYWEMGSPPIFFTYALMFKIFGANMAAIPLTDIFVSMLTTFLVFMLARYVWGRNAGYMSALMFAFFSNGVRFGMHAGGEIAFGTFWYIAQRETFMLPLTVASVYFIARAGRSEKKFLPLLLAGLCSGLTYAYKFPSLLIFLTFILYMNGVFIFTRGKDWVKQCLLGNISMILGFVLALVPFVLYFIIKGAFVEMVDVIFKYVFSVYGRLEHDYLAIIKIGMTRSMFIAQENFILWLFFITSSAYIFVKERSRENILIALWAMASIMFVISHREFFGYHFLLVLAPFSILSGYGMVRIFGPTLNLRRMFTEDFGKVFVVLALAVNVMFFTTLNYMHYTKFFYYATGKISKEDYYAFFNAYPKHDYSFPADYKVAQYIKSHTNSDDMIYVLGGIESVVYFLTKRKSPSRFIFSWIILSGTHGRVKRSEGYREELLGDLKEKTPKYILTVKPLETYQQFSDIYSFIAGNYTLDNVFPDDRYLYVHNKSKNRKI